MTFKRPFDEGGGSALELYEQCRSALEKRGLRQFLVTQAFRLRTSQHLLQRKHLPFHCGDIPLFSQRLSRFALQGERVEWDYVKAYIHCIATIEKAGGVFEVHTRLLRAS